MYSMNSSPGVIRNRKTAVTAIVPTYNRAKYLEEAVSSILDQTLAPTQVIVVDDGSTDNTREIIAGFGGSIEYIAKPNGGKSSALNFVLPRATGEFVWIFDDDDVAERDSLEKLVQALRENPECGFAYGHYDLFKTDEDGRIRRIPVSFPSVNGRNLYLALMERSFILQQGLLVRKSCYDEVGNFDESLIRSQDLDMILRLARRYRGTRVPEILFHQRQHSGIRGSKSNPVSANRAVEGWVSSDRKIIGGIYATHDLRAFLPLECEERELPAEKKFIALLQRACITARKGMWHEAAQDLGQASEIAQRTNKTSLERPETEILRRIFDLFSYAPHTFNGAGEFRQALKKIRPKALQRHMRAAILWPLPFTLGAALLNGQYANFWRFVGVYFKLATPSAVFYSVTSPSFLYAGIDLIRRRRGASG